MTCCDLILTSTHKGVVVVVAVVIVVAVVLLLVVAVGIVFIVVGVALNYHPCPHHHERNLINVINLIVY